jgi:hypothetical protein
LKLLKFNLYTFENYLELKNAFGTCTNGIGRLLMESTIDDILGNPKEPRSCLKLLLD